VPVKEEIVEFLYMVYQAICFSDKSFRVDLPYSLPKRKGNAAKKFVDIVCIFLFVEVPVSMFTPGE
jgi:hypothetical protein